MTDRQSEQEKRRELRKFGPMTRLAAFENWIEQNAPLMIELGFELDLGRLREEAADIRANLESSGGFAAPKDQLRMARWQAEQLRFVLAAELVMQRRRADNARERKANESSGKHDWDKVAQLVKALRATGVPENRIASTVKERLGVPRTTFGDWKRRQKSDG